MPECRLVGSGRLFCFPLYGLFAQDQEVAHRQHVSLGGVLNLPRASIRVHQPKRALLLPSLQKGLPQFGNLRFEAGLDEVIQTTSDDLFPWESEQLPGAGTGVAVVTVVVCDQYGRGRVVDDRPE